MRPRISYANVVSTLALALVLSGGAYAATQLPKDSVTSKQIKNSSVKSKDVRNGSLTGADLRPGVVDAEVAGTPMGGDLAGTFPNPTVDPSLFAELITQAQMEDYVASTADTLQKDEGSLTAAPGPGYTEFLGISGIVEVSARCVEAGGTRGLEVRVRNLQDFTWDFVLEQRSQTPVGDTITSNDIAADGTYTIVFAPDSGSQSARSFELTAMSAPGIRLKGAAFTSTLAGNCRVNAVVTYDDEGVV